MSLDLSTSRFNFDFVLAEMNSPQNHILQMLLRELGSQHITRVRDRSGMNLLHHAVLKNVAGKTKFLIDFARQE